jgi:hypothetical protein
MTTFESVRDMIAENVKKTLTTQALMSLLTFELEWLENNKKALE